MRAVGRDAHFSKQRVVVVLRRQTFQLGMPPRNCVLGVWKAELERPKGVWTKNAVGTLPRINTESHRSTRFLHTFPDVEVLLPHLRTPPPPSCTFATCRLRGGLDLCDAAVHGQRYVHRPRTDNVHIVVVCPGFIDINPDDGERCLWRARSARQSNHQPNQPHYTSPSHDYLHPTIYHVPPRQARAFGGG